MIEIHGKDYMTVNERLTKFRSEYEPYALDTQILSHECTEGIHTIVMKAIIADESGRVVASGTAYEVEGRGNINRTSYVENCETSAWGRALACLGIGIDESVASAEEVAQAINQQNEPETTKLPPISSRVRGILASALGTLTHEQKESFIQAYPKCLKVETLDGKEVKKLTLAEFTDKEMSVMLDKANELKATEPPF